MVSVSVFDKEKGANLGSFLGRDRGCYIVGVIQKSHTLLFLP
jgi:hypothetical protein